MARNPVSDSAPTLVRRIHIDTDPGLDDLLALGLALASPEVKLEGITTVAGNASIDAVTENACGFLALADVEIPVGRGAAAPLALTRADAEHVHGADGRKGIALPVQKKRRVATARSVLLHSLRERRVDEERAVDRCTPTVRKRRQLAQSQFQTDYNNCDTQRYLNSIYERIVELGWRLGEDPSGKNFQDEAREPT